jgi:hypothetical protein
MGGSALSTPAGGPARVRFMSHMGRPPLLRASRIFFVLGTIALVLLIAYIGSAAFYATRVTSPGTAQESAHLLPGQVLQVAATVNVSNPGPFSIAGLTLAGAIAFPNGTTWGTGTSRAVTLDGGSTEPITIAVNLFLPSLLATDRALLTEDASLPFLVWVNGTYASVVGVALEYNATYPWGAPFANLTVGFGSPAPLANGTVALPVAIDFSNDAPVDLVGTTTVAVNAGDGSPCGGLYLPIYAPAHAPFATTATMYVPAGCSLAGATYHVTWSGLGATLSLPGGRLP